MGNFIRILAFILWAFSPSYAQKGDRMPDLTIGVGTETFRVKMYENSSARAFVAALPMSITMGEFNGNEKEYHLPGNLPSEPRRVGSINTGDFMLYGASTIVLFYKSFPTPYSYTKLGHIENPKGLEAALGKGSVRVTFAKAE